MNPGISVFILACVIAGTSADYSAGTRMEKNECQLSLENCTSRLAKKEMTEVDLKAYYDCVSGIKCIRHHRGYIDRLELLSDINDRLVAENPESGNWWDNASCNLDRSPLTLITSIVATSITVYAILT